MSQHKLAGMKCYLSGSIEASRDHGIAWRKQFIDSCWDNDLPFGFIDPCNKGPGAIQEEIGEERRKLQALKAEGRFDEVTDIMKQVRRWDLRAVDYSNFIVAVIDRNVPTWGTVDECIVAERQRKPLIGIVKGGPSQAPDWLFAMMRHDEMFETADQAVEYLVKLDRGEIPLDKRWIEITGLWENEQRYSLPLLGE
tara:strand:+ start:99069 stop:99656 length:588 start_codon:yes stop_codon:yes gene_type:complete